MAVLQYVTQFETRIREMYGHELISNALFQSNPDINIRGAKEIKLLKMTVSGYKDHTRGALGFNTGNYSNDFEVKTLDHDRDIEFVADSMDVDETNQIVAIANIHRRFESTQAIPELACYTFSKLYAEAERVGAEIKHVTITAANVLEDFDANCEKFEDAGVPLSRCILYCTVAYKKALKNAEGIARQLNVADGSFKKIIDMYNSFTPRARNYILKYNDEWCSGYASAVAITVKYTEIIPLEVGCENHIQLFKNKGIWVENDGYIPKPGYYIFCDWNDNGKGDCTGSADHVGIVIYCDGVIIKVIEGNYSSCVKTRTLSVNGKYILGFGVPKYDEDGDIDNVVEIKLVVDGLWGPAITRRAQEVFGTPVDGKVDTPSAMVKAFQRWLNEQ